MNKQTKQLIVLGALVVVGGIVAYFMLFAKDDPAPKKAGNDTKKAAANSGKTKPAASGKNTKATTAKDPKAGKAATPAVQVADLDMPDPVTFLRSPYVWPWPGHGSKFRPDLAAGIYAAFDPLLVQNIDVVDPDRKQYIEQVRAEWEIDGIMETEQEMQVVDPYTGKGMLGKSITRPRPQLERVPKKDPVTGKYVFDKDGNVLMEDVPKKDAAGKVVFEPELDENGIPKMENGKPVYKQDIIYVEVDAEGKVLKYDAEGKITTDKTGMEREVRNPTREDRVKRKVEQVKLVKTRTIVDKDGNPVLVNGVPQQETYDVKDEDGEQVYVDDQTPQLEVRMVLEATFKDKRKPFKEGDRLTGTRFSILTIFKSRKYPDDEGPGYKVRSGVDLIGDTGARLTLFLADDSRYEPDTKAAKGK